MGKHKLKHSNDKRGDAALAHSFRKRMLNLDLDNLNHSAKPVEKINKETPVTSLYGNLAG